MLLLYCQNAIVIGTHDDVQNVPASAYGTGTQIVPLPPGVALVRVGPAPPPGIPDDRPLGRPTETKEILLAYAAQVRFETSIRGLSVTEGSVTIPAKTDRVSQALLNNLSTYAGTILGTSAVTFTQDNVVYDITANQAQDLFNKVMAFVQSCRDIEGQCITDLNSASPTILTYNDVDARFASVRARNLPEGIAS